MRIDIEKQRQIVRLLSQTPALSNRTIGNLVKVSHNTVRSVRDRLLEKNEGWSSLQGLDNQTFTKRLGLDRQAPSPRKVLPNWHDIHDQLRERDMTLDLLWQEYRETERNGVSYSQFTRYYRQWKNKQKISLRQIHAPGDKIFVDFCGRTVPIVSQETGEVTNAQVFVACLGGSGYLFATAVGSQSIQDWLHCHIEMFEHVGGVPNFVVPDNLKSAVIRSQRDGIELNRFYSELAEHYGFVILPARPKKPKDKSLAEVGVQVVQRWVLARLRNQTFFSLDDLNKNISYWMSQLNERTTKTYTQSRKDRFNEIDLPALKEMPDRGYEYREWRYQVRVKADYHIEHEGHYYSVPYQYAHQMVDVRTGREWLEVVHQRTVIATHRVVRHPGVSTQPEHQPPSHLCYRDAQPDALISWAEQVGPKTSEFVQGNLRDRQKFASGLKAIWHLKKDVRDQKISNESLEAACAYALDLGTISTTRLKSILRNGSFVRHTKSSPPTVVEHSNIRGPNYYSS